MHIQLAGLKYNCSVQFYTIDTEISCRLSLAFLIGNVGEVIVGSLSLQLNSPCTWRQEFGKDKSSLLNS